MDKVLLIDDEADVQYSFRRIFDQPGIELTTAQSGEEGLKLIPRLKPDLVIMDVRMGGINGLETLRRLRQSDARQMVIMMTAYGTTQTAIEAMKLGAYDYLLKPFDVPRLKQIVLNALKAARDMREAVSYEPLLESEDYDVGIIGRSEAMQGVFKIIGQLAASNATALITGQSGTGKELIARAIYHHSQRSGRPFLTVNCAAIPENLLESELFGHEKGAFTGASAQRIGKFEQCHGGTIFLDEIGDMTLSTQAKILRVLQSGSFERVGGNQPIQVDVRVIAATHRALEQAVAAREFREDLFYRLNVVRIHVPPLRDRRQDIPLLVNYFLKKFAQAQGARAQIHLRRRGRDAGAVPLAGQRARIGECHAAGHRHGQGRRAAARRLAAADLQRPRPRGRAAAGARTAGAGGGQAGGHGGHHPRLVPMGGGESQAQDSAGRRAGTDHSRAAGNQGQPGAGGPVAGHHARHLAQARGEVPHQTGTGHPVGPCHTHQTYPYYHCSFGFHDRPRHSRRGFKS